MGIRGDLTSQQLTLRDRYAEGLAAYRARRWADARSAFRAALEAVSDDEPSKNMMKRMEDFDARPPAGDWDGSWHFDHK